MSIAVLDFWELVPVGRQGNAWFEGPVGGEFQCNIWGFFISNPRKDRKVRKIL
jgi:hypothetical protein